MSPSPCLSITLSPRLHVSWCYTLFSWLCTQNKWIYPITMGMATMPLLYQSMFSMITFPPLTWNTHVLALKHKCNNNEILGVMRCTVPEPLHTTSNGVFGTRAPRSSIHWEAGSTGLEQSGGKGIIHRHRVKCMLASGLTGVESDSSTRRPWSPTDWIHQMYFSRMVCSFTLSLLNMTRIRHCFTFIAQNRKLFHCITFSPLFHHHFISLSPLSQTFYAISLLFHCCFNFVSSTQPRIHGFEKMRDYREWNICRNYITRKRMK